MEELLSDKYTAGRIAGSIAGELVTFLIAIQFGGLLCG